MQANYRAIFTEMLWPNRPQWERSPMSLPAAPCWRDSNISGALITLLGNGAHRWGCRVGAARRSVRDARSIFGEVRELRSCLCRPAAGFNDGIPFAIRQLAWTARRGSGLTSVQATAHANYRDVGLG
jgi:hypothetical protein